MSNIIGRFINFWLHPFNSFASIKEEGEASIKPNILYVVIMGAITGIISSVMAQFIPPPLVEDGLVPKWFTWLYVVFIPLGSFIMSFVGAYILMGLIYGLMKGTMGNYKSAYRILALMASIQPVSVILTQLPKVGVGFTVGLFVWQLFLIINATIIVAAVSKVKSYVTYIGFVLFFALLALLAQVASTQNPALTGAPGGEPGAGAEFNLDENELDQAIAELEANEKK